MSHLSPEEIEKIKEEQRLRTSETVKTGVRMYFGFVGKVLMFTCGCLMVLILGGFILLFITNGISSRNQQKQVLADATRYSEQRTIEAKQILIKTPEPSNLTPPQQTDVNVGMIPVTNTPNIPGPTSAKSRLPASTATITPTSEGPFIYKIGSDQETPTCIARRFNVDLTELLALNNLTLNSNLPVGTKILIPQAGNLWSSGDRALKPHPTTYIVLSSDTIYGIACQFGDVFPEEIARVNGLVEPYDLSPGQELEIP
jgi:hypothetical protein